MNNMKQGLLRYSNSLYLEQKLKYTQLRTFEGERVTTMKRFVSTFIPFHQFFIFGKDMVYSF